MDRSDIDNVKFYSINKSGSNLLAFASVTFTNGLTVKAKVMKGTKGLWVPMESFKKEKTDGTSEYVNLCYFADKNDSQTFQDAVLELWAKESGTSKSPETSKSNGKTSNNRPRERVSNKNRKNSEFVQDEDGDLF